MESSTPPISHRILGTSLIAIRIQFIAQLLIGLGMSFFYRPSPAVAHTDVANMHSQTIFGFFQGMHYWGSAVLILHMFGHVVAGVWTGWFRRPNGLAFLESVLSFFIAIAFQMSGNVLPFDRHGVQTAGIEASIGARTPLVGAHVSQWILGGQTFDEHTLELWYAIHRFVLPAALILLWGFAYAIVRRNAPVRNPDQKRYLPIAAFAPMLVVALLAAFVKSPLGSLATTADYGAFDARVSWYVWPLHGTMRLFDGLASGAGWIGAIALPGLFLAFLFVLPIAPDRCSLSWARGGIGGFLVLFAAGGIFYGGSFAPLIGTRDPVAATASSDVKSAVIDKTIAEQGRKAFNQLACAGCHGVDGAKASGGPALTGVWRKHGDADYYERYIKNPVAVQPDSTMPAFGSLEPGQLKALAEFLRMPK